MGLQVDGNVQNVYFNGTNIADESTPAFTWNMQDGDHQIFGYTESLRENATIAVDYFE